MVVGFNRLLSALLNYTGNLKRNELCMRQLYYIGIIGHFIVLLFTNKSMKINLNNDYFYLFTVIKTKGR